MKKGQLQQDAIKLEQLKLRFFIDHTDTSADNNLDLAGRSCQILYGKATNSQLLNYKKIIDSELQSRGNEQTIALSSVSGAKFFIERWGFDFYQAILPYPIKTKVKERHPSLSKEVSKALVNYVVETLRNNQISEATLQLIRTELNDDEIEDMIEMMGADLDNHSNIVKTVQKLHKKGKETPGIILLTINVPLGKKVEIREDQNTGQYPILVDNYADTFEDDKRLRSIEKI